MFFSYEDNKVTITHGDKTATWTEIARSGGNSKVLEQFNKLLAILPIVSTDAIFEVFIDKGNWWEDPNLIPALIGDLGVIVDNLGFNNVHRYGFLSKVIRHDVDHANLLLNLTAPLLIKAKGCDDSELYSRTCRAYFMSEWVRFSAIRVYAHTSQFDMKHFEHDVFAYLTGQVSTMAYLADHSGHVYDPNGYLKTESLAGAMVFTPTSTTVTQNDEGTTPSFNEVYENVLVERRKCEALSPAGHKQAMGRLTARQNEVTGAHGSNPLMTKHHIEGLDTDEINMSLVADDLDLNRPPALDRMPPDQFVKITRVKGTEGFIRKTTLQKNQRVAKMCAELKELAKTLDIKVVGYRNDTTTSIAASVTNEQRADELESISNTVKGIVDTGEEE